MICRLAESKENPCVSALTIDVGEASRCFLEWAPWYVIPANRNWYRNLAVASVIVQALEDLKLKYPEPAEDLDRIVIQ